MRLGSLTRRHLDEKETGKPVSVIRFRLFGFGFGYSVSVIRFRFRLFGFGFGYSVIRFRFRLFGFGYSVSVSVSVIRFRFRFRSLRKIVFSRIYMNPERSVAGRSATLPRFVEGSENGTSAALRVECYSLCSFF